MSTSTHPGLESPPDLPVLFAAIIAGLCRIVAEHGGGKFVIFRSSARPEGRPSGPFIVLLHNRLQRAVRRFQALVQKFRAGTLTSPRLRAGGPHLHEPRPDLPHWPRLPTAAAWLIKFIPWKAAAFGSQLQNLIDTDPEMAALIDAAPRQVGRVLRPLCKALAIRLPPALRAPPTRPPPRTVSTNQTATDESSADQCPAPISARPSPAFPAGTRVQALWEFEDWRPKPA